MTSTNFDIILTKIEKLIENSYEVKLTIKERETKYGIDALYIEVSRECEFELIQKIRTYLANKAIQKEISVYQGDKYYFNDFLVHIEYED